jgi:hypothetical protein
MLTIIIEALEAIHAEAGPSSEFRVYADTRNLLHFAFPAPSWRREFCEPTLL